MTTPTVPAPLHDDVQYRSSMLRSENAIMEWTGETVRLQLEPVGTVIFDVRPEEISKVRVIRRVTMIFTVDGHDHRVIYPGEAQALLQGPYSTGTDDFSRPDHRTSRADMMASWPSAQWVSTLRALGVDVHDRKWL